MHRSLRLVLNTLLLAGWLVASAGAYAADQQAGGATEVQLKADPAPAKQTPPSFAPGAEVTLKITLQAPDQWVLNYMVPIRLQFDEKQLKDAPYKVSKTTWDFTIEHYVPRQTFELPITLAKGVADGTLDVPVGVLCSICAGAGDECTFVMETAVVHVKVQAKAEPGAKDQALSKGAATCLHHLSLP